MSKQPMPLEYASREAKPRKGRWWLDVALWLMALGIIAPILIGAATILWRFARELSR